MINLDEMQFEILESELSDSGVGFGLGHNVSIDDNGFDPGSVEWSVQDSTNPMRGNSMFGRDVVTGKSWSWSMHTDMEDTQGALAAIAELERAWRGEHVAHIPGAVLPLRYRIGDRVRRVYGRPRRWAAPPSNRILSGFVPITADFKVADDLHYSDELHSATMNLFTESQGGLVLPATLPASTLPSGAQDSSVVVGGEAPTYCKIRFDGPLSGAYLETDDWRLDFTGPLGDLDHVIIDTHPWGVTGLTVIQNGTMSVPGKLGRRQWLQDIKLKPGPRQFRFGGSSTSGAGRCTVTWRNAFYSL